MLSECFMLEKSRPLTLDLMQEILNSGFSRIPVYDQYEHNLRHFVLVKKMITVSPSDWSPQTIKDLPKEKLICVEPSIHMLDLLNEFQDKKCHLALVADDPQRVEDAWKKDEKIPVDIHMIGIITLEDVIEKMLQEEIYDEVDKVDKVTAPSIKRVFSRRAQSAKTGRQLSDLETPLLKNAGTAPVDMPAPERAQSHQHWT